MSLLPCDYDLISDPQTVAIVRAQQSATGQRRRRLRRPATHHRGIADPQRRGRGAGRAAR